MLAFSIVRFVPIVLDDANGLLAAGEFLLRGGVAAALLALAVGLLVHYAPGVNRPLPCGAAWANQLRLMAAGDETHGGRLLGLCAP